MSTTDNTSYDYTSLFDDATQQFYAIQFWIFLLLFIPSIIISLFALYHFFLDRALRQPLYNHVIIGLFIIDLFFQLTDVSWYIYYFRCFLSFPRSPIFRLVWGYIDWSGYEIQVILYAWVTIERHILIFHEKLLDTRKKRLFLHYLPPVIITIYCLLYYAMVFFASKCENDFDGLTSPSLYPCAYQNNTLSMYESIAHGILPIFTIVISSAVLLLRTMWQRYHVQRQIHWRRYRKMTVQVLIISSVYFMFPLPFALLSLLNLCNVLGEIGVELIIYVAFIPIYTTLLFPIVALGSLPELREKFKKTLQFRRQRRVVRPANFPTAHIHMADNRVVIQ